MFDKIFCKKGGGAVDAMVTWFVPRDMLPWELYVLRSLAGGLKGHGVALNILSQHPGAWGTLPVLYWDAARVGERWRHLLCPGALWHFWGSAPWWRCGQRRCTPSGGLQVPGEAWRLRFRFRMPEKERCGCGPLLTNNFSGMTEARHLPCAAAMDV